MNASKSLNLIVTAYQLTGVGMNILVLKPSIDTRSSKGKVTSRIGVEFDCVDIDTENDLSFLEDRVKELDAIFIDECQFLTVEQVRKLIDIVTENKIKIFAYGLRNTANRELFPASAELLAHADVIQEMRGVCEKCGDKGLYNIRLKDGKICEEKNGFYVDGKDGISYLVVCRKCWNNITRAHDGT
jgi:thymidine kinase